MKSGTKSHRQQGYIQHFCKNIDMKIEIRPKWNKLNFLGDETFLFHGIKFDEGE